MKGCKEAYIWSVALPRPMWRGGMKEMLVRYCKTKSWLGVVWSHAQLTHLPNHNNFVLHLGITSIYDSGKRAIHCMERQERNGKATLKSKRPLKWGPKWSQPIHSLVQNLPQIILPFHSIFPSFLLGPYSFFSLYMASWLSSSSFDFLLLCNLVCFSIWIIMWHLH